MMPGLIELTRAPRLPHRAPRPSLATRRAEWLPRARGRSVGEVAVGRGDRYFGSLHDVGDRYRTAVRGESPRRGDQCCLVRCFWFRSVHHDENSLLSCDISLITIITSHKTGGTWARGWLRKQPHDS
jgi:hypothetical protein